MASCFLLHGHCSHWAQKAWTQSCRTGRTAKFFAEVAFDWSARISSVLNRFTVNDVTSSALTVSGEGEHASITVGTVHRIMWEGFGDWNVSPVLHRMEIWLSICLRIFLRVCLISCSVFPCGRLFCSRWWGLHRCSHFALNRLQETALL